MKISDLIEKLYESEVRNVLIEGYHDLERNKSTKRIVILCENQKAVASVLGLDPFSPPTVSRDGIYVSKDINDLKIVIYEKGKGVFPERFESELLSGRIISKCGMKFYRPDEEREFLSQIYMCVVHKGIIKGEFRESALRKIALRIGMPTKPKYTSIPFYNSTELPPDVT